MNAMLVAKDKILAELHIKKPAKNSMANPLRSAARAEDAMRMLLAKNNDVHITGTEAIEAGCDEIIQHQTAVMNAMRCALEDYLAYFEPESLERHFDNLKKRGNAKKAFEDLYKEAYEGLSQPNKHRLPQRFDDEFAKAYELETTS